MSTFTPPALHGIIGYPLGHSMSPLMHNTAFRTLNLPGVYLSWPIEPGRLPAFVDAARLLNIRGCSITIPHKIDIIPLLDKTSENVREIVPGVPITPIFLFIVTAKKSAEKIPT